MHVRPTNAEVTTIPIGPWTFENNAFADNATLLDSVKQIWVGGVDDCFGTEDELGTARFVECVNLALKGYSPETFFVNTGSAEDTASNWFQLDFTDMKAENHAGADLVFFECRFNDFNAYQIAVRPEDGSFTGFHDYTASDFEETDVVCSDPATIWGMEIDLSDFGLPADTVVDAIQFKVLDPDPGDPEIQPEGEPAMAAVLTESFGPPTIYLPIVSKNN
jgi:hypothetical protein